MVMLLEIITIFWFQNIVKKKNLCPRVVYCLNGRRLFFVLLVFFHSLCLVIVSRFCLKASTVLPTPRAFFVLFCSGNGSTSPKKHLNTPKSTKLNWCFFVPQVTVSSLRLEAFTVLPPIMLSNFEDPVYKGVIPP